MVQSLFDHDEPGRHYRAISRRDGYVGNLPPMPGVFPDYPAPVVRNVGAERELTMMRWGMPNSFSKYAPDHPEPADKEK